ncbi:hypothetical protein [Pseudothauera rhizosphaerae]|uniref:hypothetical protein n=1 Tax=Pseudothauera rhizosphaerae TaxID=2565932 RepID=UPI001E510D2E|nr:hypothetical protein [Pseudothauera rhizosphaerae]
MDYRNPAECLAELPKLHPLDVDATHATLSAMVAGLLDAVPAANQHLEVLEAAREQIALVQAEYARRYAAQPLPPDSEENNVLQSVVALWLGMARSYAQITRQDAPHGTLAEQLPLLIQRRLQYTGLAILEYLRAHRAVPRGYWADLHECFVIAEQSGKLRVRVSDPLNDVWHAQSALEAYVGVLLVDLGNPFARAEREFNLICKWAQRFAPYCDISADADPARHQTYALDLTLDHALRPIGVLTASASLRRFDGSRLSGQIQAVFGQLKQGVSPASLGLGSDCPAATAARLLVSLYRPWGLASAGRRFPRRGARGTASVCGDWLAIGYHVAGQVFEQPKALDGIKSLRSDISLMTFGERAPEVEHPRTAAERERRAEELGFACVHWQVADQSVTGFRLTQLQEHERLEHHQLIGIRPPDSDNFLLARISWLMYRNDGVMEAGVQVLPGLPEVLAARILTLHVGNRTPYSQAFLVPGTEALKTPDTLVLPHGWFQPNRVIEVFRNERLAQYRLLKALLQGPNFDQVSFEISAPNHGPNGFSQQPGGRSESVR